MHWNSAQNRLALLRAVDELHHGPGHVRDVIQAPVDHQRREEELEQQREAGLPCGRRERHAQRQLPGLPRAARGMRARFRPAQPQCHEPQPLQEHEGLGMQPGVRSVEGDQYQRIQRDQREQQAVHGEHGIDVEHAELPLAVQRVAMKAADVGDHPVSEGDEPESR